jgi:predicted nucleotidyltransferase
MVKSYEEIEKLLSEHRKELEEKFGVIHIGVFGSFGTNEQREESDVDLIVKIDRKKDSYRNTLKLKEYLESLLGRKVDIIKEKVLERGVLPTFAKNIERSFKGVF